MDLGLNGRTAIITGASRGIGRAVAERLAAEGCHLHLVARTRPDLEQLRDRLASQHAVQVHIHVADLSVSDSIDALAARCGEVDILVNNAGAIPGGSLIAVDDATWRAAWDLKVFGFVNFCRAMYPRMKARGKGVIINIVGIAGGEVTEFNYIVGTAGNASLAAFTKALGSGSPADNIRVLGVNPGPTATDRLVSLMQQNAVAKGLDSQEWRQLTAHLPFGRPGEPNEVADLVAFLASDRATYISGTLVTIDGGLSARGRLF
jgi:NAD(P)-dependent dehydrogenase (short-subunit alcohol dehydrogenase family)